MKFVIAIDSFKGSITSLEAGTAAAEGIKRCLPNSEIQIMPIADGGEGTVDALISHLNGTYKTVAVKDPLCREITATYGTAGNLAIMEMSAASGIALLTREELNPMVATTYGVGQMIKDAISSGCREFLIGIGGSATNDGGVGMLQALGFAFLDADGNSIGFGAEALGKIHSICDKNAMPELKECTFHIACDVKNPLCGEQGCSAIFSPQKGATPEQIPQMDKAMAHYAQVTRRFNPQADDTFPGAGAAGGLGFAFLAYLNGKLQSGIELILNKIQIEQAISQADLVITGEGRLDGQTVMGKVPVGIARLAKKYHKPVLGFSGCVTREAATCNNHGIDAFFPIVRTPCTLEEAMNPENAKQNMADCVEQAIRLYVAASK